MTGSRITRWLEAHKRKTLRTLCMKHFTSRFLKSLRKKQYTSTTFTDVVRKGTTVIPWYFFKGQQALC